MRDIYFSAFIFFPQYKAHQSSHDIIRKDHLQYSTSMPLDGTAFIQNKAIKIAEL